MVDIHSPTRIHLSYLDGIRPPEWKDNSLWPRQFLPSPSQRRLWKRFLKSSYLRYVPFWTLAPPATPVLSDRVIAASPTSVSLSNVIKHLPRTERRMVASLELLSHQKPGVDFFTSKKMVTIAFDGGLHGTKGTFGWVVARKTKVVLQCSGPVDGSRDTASSTRSELWGYASSLLSLVLVSRVWKCQYRCRFRWLVDSRAAISRVRKYLQWGHLKRGRQPPDVDILSIIWKYYKALGKKIRITWIKAHQDDHVNEDKLSSSAKLNTWRLNIVEPADINHANRWIINQDNGSPSLSMGVVSLASMTQAFAFMSMVTIFASIFNTKDYGMIQHGTR
jgi:hypothetical protein